MKLKVILITLLLFLLTGVFLISASRAKAACCIDDCYDPVTGHSTGVCCKLDLECLADYCAAYPTDAQCIGGGGNYAECKFTRNCPAGTHPDWNQTTGRCVSWGKLCGDCIKEAGTNYCSPCDDPPCKQQSVKYCTCCAAYQPSYIIPAPSSDGTSATISWTPGANTVSQRLYVGPNTTEVTNLCSASPSTCVYKNESMPADQTSQQITGLTPGTVYYYKMSSVGETGCRDDTATLKFLSSCQFNPTSAQLDPGQSTTLQTNVINNSVLNRVVYTLPNNTVVKITAPNVELSGKKGTDTGYPYSVTIKAQNVPSGNVSLHGSVRFDGATGTEICGADALITVGNVPVVNNKWWQIKDSDIASSGQLQSLVPSGNFFGLPGDGGYPGVAAYTTSSNFGDGTVADPPYNWLAQSQNLSSRDFNYQFFKNQIPQNITDNIKPIQSDDLSGATADPEGYEWYKYTGGTALSINSNIDIGTRKVILLVEGTTLEGANLSINGRINLTDGQGFFMAIVAGDISINPNLGGTGTPDLEGIYVADGTIHTGSSGPGTDSQLYVRGSMAGISGINLQRDTTDNSSPAEFFEYAPDQIMLFPSKLGYRKINWKEVAP